MARFSQVLDISSVGSGSLKDLHEQIIRRADRVELCRDGCDDRCIVISKSELDSIERALEILASTEEVRELARLVAQIAQRCVAFDTTTPPPYPPAA
jgi:PHD/YefM family antitoxin component YafN of YafNO toxin-antitoxin module